MEHGSEETTGHSQSFLPSLGGRQFDKAGTDAKRSTGLGACSQAEAPLEGLPRPYRDPQGCWDTPSEPETAQSRGTREPPRAEKLGADEAS